MYKKAKTHRSTESNEEYMDMDYNAKTEAVSCSGGSLPQAPYQTIPHYVSPSPTSTNIASGNGSEELDQKAEPMYEELEMEKYER